MLRRYDTNTFSNTIPHLSCPLSIQKCLHVPPSNFLTTVLNLVYSIHLSISQHYLLLFLMQTDTTTANTNAVITNTASNPGTVSFDEVDVDADVDEFSGCVVGVNAGADIS